jgi:hypothetical protein
MPEGRAGSFEELFRPIGQTLSFGAKRTIRSRQVMSAYPVARGR